MSCVPEIAFPPFDVVDFADIGTDQSPLKGG